VGGGEAFYMEIILVSDTVQAALRNSDFMYQQTMHNLGLV
jgi:hypothetical protein